MIETVGIVVLWLLGGGLLVLGAFLWLVDTEASRVGGVEQSRFPKVMTALGAVLLIVLLTGCASFSSAPVYGEIPRCEKLIPPVLKAPVPGVPIPVTEEVADWMQGFLGQTGQLDKANDRPEAIDHIYRTCLDMHRDALERTKRGFFGRLFGG